MLSRSGPSSWASKGKRWNGKVDGDRGNEALPVDVVRLMKTQDMGYLRTVRNVAAKEVKGLEERVIGMGGSPDAGAFDEDSEDEDWDDEGPARKKPKKIVFAEGVSERDEKLLAEAEKELADADRDSEDDEAEVADKDGDKDPASLRKEQKARLLLKLQRRLQLARKKLKTLSTAEQQLELQRARMAKSATIGGTTKDGKKFKVRERKR